MEDSVKAILDMLPLLIPAFIIQLALMVIALVDVVRRERVRGGNKVVWILVIVIINFIGPIIYLLFGRQEAPVDSD
jgi:hypothetical protein